MVLLCQAIREKFYGHVKKTDRIKERHRDKQYLLRRFIFCGKNKIKPAVLEKCYRPTKKIVRMKEGHREQQYL